ncbi:hypothetical protein [Enterococcus ureasiticus]|uniref:Uncharacterized protein n=1 Tax=Enterococcus ureasiticus TaxID=903984 RepID=A0A1E5GHA9_9ENTE|nr:hypothetical protein [Enterococcus ureasiticus]OEG11975.1 hypothetical protein BCR21_06990 [Enterococcus ureasiticus]
MLNQLATSIGNGTIETGFCARNNLLGTKIVIKKSLGDSTNEGVMQLTIELYPKPIIPTDIRIPQPEYDQAYRDVEAGKTPQLNVEVILKGVALTGLAIVIVVGLATGVAEVASVIAAFFGTMAGAF